MSDPTLKAMVCPHCGTVAAPGEAFCRNCGKQLLAPTIAAPPPLIPPLQQQPARPSYSQPPARKRRSPFMMGCLIIFGLLLIGAAAGGIYIWRRASYTPPVRTAPDIPQRAAGTLTEFPVDNDPNAPARPTSVHTEALTGDTAKAAGYTPAKLPPGIDRSSLSKGATTMTSATYKPKPKTAPTVPSTKDEIYICVLVATNQPGFIDDLATSVVSATGGQQTGVRVQSPKGPIYTGSSVRSSQGTIYVLNKQGGEIVILIFAPDPAMQSVVDRLAQNVNNGEGLNDYPEIKNAFWTLPAQTPSDLTLVSLNTLTSAQIENSMSGNSGGSDLPPAMRPFIPNQMTAARYVDSSRQEWVAVNLEYESSFQAWRTWLLARGALGLGGAQTTTVREVDGLYLNQEGKRLLIFQKGPYLIFLTGPAAATQERLVALGNQFQV